MELCGNGHDEVCFLAFKRDKNGSFSQAYCPCCTAIQDRDKEIESLQSELACLKSAVEDLTFVGYRGT